MIFYLLSAVILSDINGKITTKVTSVIGIAPKEDLHR